MKSCLPVLFIAGSVLLVACRGTAPAASRGAAVPDDPEAVTPILVGATLPDIELTTPTGEPFDLTAAVRRQPTVLVYYRGGWCPYCTAHLMQLQEAEDTLVELGYQILAVSPDRPEILRETATEGGFQYRLLSDSSMSGARALGIAFRVPDSTVTRYRLAHNIDIESDSGQTHHQLPVPTVLVLDTDAVVRFAYVNPNYKVRLPPDVLLAAARAASERG